jgi:hypothetical protein
LWKGKGSSMASNFRIAVKKNDKDIHLKPIGGFDGSSALELIFFMNSCLTESDKVFINTDFLCFIEPFDNLIFDPDLSGSTRFFIFIGGGSRFIPWMLKKYGIPCKLQHHETFGLVLKYRIEATIRPAAEVNRRREDAS